MSGIFKINNSIVKMNNILKQINIFREIFWNEYAFNARITDYILTSAVAFNIAVVMAARAMYSMGKHTMSVPMELFATNRKRLCERLKTKVQNGVVLLQGGSGVPLYCTDVDYNTFQQEPYFHWTFGVLEPDVFGTVEIPSGKSTLFVPRMPESYNIFMGALPSLEDFKKKYAVDSVHYSDQMKNVLQGMRPEVLLTLLGVNSDSKLTCKEATFDGISEFKVDNTILHPEIAELRVFKTKLELDVLRYTNQITSDAHKLVMQCVKPGMHEYQAEAIFLEHAYYAGGCRHVAYTCICGSGHNGSVLHYGHAAAPNDKLIKDGDMLLFDMGAKYYGYSSDVTCSYPANGKFTNQQKDIYNSVWAAVQEVEKTMRPGISWVDMHRLAYRTMLTKLKQYGILVGNVDEMMEANLGATFQPHGLGHFMGIDVHDVGGYLDKDPPRPKLPGFANLRTARVLQAGMVITVEPGCYFIDSLLDKALADPTLNKFLVADKIKSLRGFGGVRIEDDVVVTETGIENLTKVPRTIEDIEALMGTGKGKAQMFE